MSNIRFQNALRRIPQRIPPVWFMRQAGRYHRHYQNLRAKNSFVDLCKNPELASEVALGPVLDFDFDAAILFSDILFPLEALGMGLKYDPKPELSFSLTKETFGRLNVKGASERLLFQKEALIQTREKLPKDKSLIGFVGGPWTLFTYATEGGHQGGLKIAKKNFELFQSFSEITVNLLIENIASQLEGGAEVVMIFDTASGELSPDLFQKWIVPGIKQISERFPGSIGYYSKLTTPYHLVDPFFRSGVLAGIGVDHRWDLTKVLVESKGFVQGNFDQALLFQDPKVFESSLREYCKPFEKLDKTGWICGLGHGVLPETPEENVRRFVKLIREIFA